MIRWANDYDDNGISTQQPNTLDEDMATVPTVTPIPNATSSIPTPLNNSDSYSVDTFNSPGFYLSLSRILPFLVYSATLIFGLALLFLAWRICRIFCKCGRECHRNHQNRRQRDVAAANLRQSRRIRDLTQELRTAKGEHAELSARLLASQLAQRESLRTIGAMTGARKKVKLPHDVDLELADIREECGKR